MKTVPICSLVSLLKRGVSPKYADSGNLVLNQKCIRDYSVDLAPARHIHPDLRVAAEKWVRQWDVLVNSTGVGTLGRVAQITRQLPLKTTVDSHVMIVRPDLDLVEPLYFGYAIKLAQPQIEAMGAGATGQTELSRERLGEEIAIPVPDRQVQRRIGLILSAYDDLLEKNARRSAILEQMVRQLYSEWFVHFRFPGHEEAEFEEEGPKGWRATAISEVCSYLNRGLTPQYAEDGTSLVINQKCIRNQKLDLMPSRRQKKAIPEDKLVRFGDVLINSTGVGTLGRVAQVYSALERVTVDTHVTIARPSGGVEVDYFGMSLIALQPHFEDQGVGSTGQTELSRSRIGETTILLPSKELQEMFGRYVAPMRSMCGFLANKNANLRAQRDMLLPKLISGEINVSGVEEVLEAAE